MITTEHRNELRTESILSGTFTIGKDSSGVKWVVINNIIIDLITLKLLLLWKMTSKNSNFMWHQASIHQIDTTIKSANPELEHLDSNYKIISKIHQIFTDLTKDQTNADLMNRYAQFIEN